MGPPVATRWSLGSAPPRGARVPHRAPRRAWPEAAAAAARARRARCPASAAVGRARSGSPSPPPPRSPRSRTARPPHRGPAQRPPPGRGGSVPHLANTTEAIARILDPRQQAVVEGRVQGAPEGGEDLALEVGGSEHRLGGQAMPPRKKGHERLAGEQRLGSRCPRGARRGGRCRGPTRRVVDVSPGRGTGDASPRRRGPGCPRAARPGSRGAATSEAGGGIRSEGWRRRRPPGGPRRRRHRSWRGSCMPRGPGRGRPRSERRRASSGAGAGHRARSRACGSPGRGAAARSASGRPPGRSAAPPSPPGSSAGAGGRSREMVEPRHPRWRYRQVCSPR